MVAICGRAAAQASGVAGPRATDLSSPTLPSSIGLATDAVVVAVQVRAVSRIAAMYRCGTGGVRLSTVGECAAGSRRLSCWRELRGRRGLRPVGGCRVRGRAMAVVVAGLAIGVAALGVEAAAMGARAVGTQQRQGGEDDAFHPVPPRIEPALPGRYGLARCVPAGCQRPCVRDSWPSQLARHLTQLDS